MAISLARSPVVSYHAIREFHNSPVARKKRLAFSYRTRVHYHPVNFMNMPPSKDHGHDNGCTDDVHRCTCHFSGRVQGVGFRYTAQNIALQYNVCGYVRNLSDGRVELVMEGPDGELTGFIDSLKQKMNAYIRQLEQQLAPPTGEFHRFSIRH